MRQMQIFNEMASELTRNGLWLNWAETALRVVVILWGAWAVTHLARRLLGRLRFLAIRAMDRHGGTGSSEIEKRADTLISVLSKTTGFVVWLVALVMALTEMNFHIEPLLAGLGVAGLAVGLGAQALIKDWLGGLLILIEDQIRIGDSVNINGTAGTVEEINLRTTILRGENGAVHIIANGLITTLSNLTREYSYYIFETTVAHGADADRALDIVQEAGTELAASESFGPLILAPIEVMGIDRLADRGIVLRARIKTLPSKQGIIGRELNRRINSRLHIAKIAFPALGSPQ